MSRLATSAPEPLILGRYALFGELASGGMATVHLGRLLGPPGVGRIVAIKRLHEQYLTDQEFVTMFMDEARIVARFRHPNIVPMVEALDHAHTPGATRGLYIVMEYVHGESFSRLLRTARAAHRVPPPRILVAVVANALHGLHAAHETRAETGQLLGVVHRDVSPQNVIVGADGVARVLDFGIAKAAGRAQVTREGQLKGKLAYMSPEQIGGHVDRRTDVFAAAVVLWEALAGRRFHEGAKGVEVVMRIARGAYRAPSEHAPGIPPALDDVVMRGLSSDPSARFQTAAEMAYELDAAVGLASPGEVSAWVEQLAGGTLSKRGAAIAHIEQVASELALTALADEAPTTVMGGVAQDGTRLLANAAPAQQPRGVPGQSLSQPVASLPPSLASQPMHAHHHAPPSSPIHHVVSRPIPVHHASPVASLQHAPHGLAHVQSRPVAVHAPPHAVPAPPRIEEDGAPWLMPAFVALLVMVGVALFAYAAYEHGAFRSFDRAGPARSAAPH